MATNLTDYARAGYGAPDAAPPHLYSSPAWFGFRAGQALFKSGRSGVAAARMSRGYTVRIETAGGADVTVRFSGPDLADASVERIS